ncbi:hypothetical protein Bbelb_316570 [Branchiostoma belcheri]|nr:hypothetical protein Bbelb_316570 [Branchiostoma belcheri]
MWSEQAVQAKLESFRNKEGYAMLEKALREEGYVRSAKQIQVKLRDLKAGYRKCKKKNNRSGNGRTSCPFYQELDVVLGTRPATEPSFLLETTGHEHQYVSRLLPIKPKHNQSTQAAANDTEKDMFLYHAAMAIKSDINKIPYARRMLRVTHAEIRHNPLHIPGQLHGR